MLKELSKYRELLYVISYRDIRVRYKQSVMGFLWAVLMPILIVASGVVVRYAYAIVAHVSLKSADIASVAVRSVPWAFIASSLRFTCYSLSNNRDLVVKIYFPKEILPMAAVLACIFDQLVAWLALIIVLTLMKVGASAELLWVPLLLSIIVVLCLGIGMLISSATLFFRDVKYIVEIILTFGIFFTPVFYDIHMLGHLGRWLMLNPTAPLLDGLSNCIVRHEAPDLIWCSYSFAFSVTAFIVGYLSFKHLEPAFAESI